MVRSHYAKTLFLVHFGTFLATKLTKLEINGVYDVNLNCPDSYAFFGMPTNILSQLRCVHTVEKFHFS